MLWKSEKLAININILEFKNKKLIKALKMIKQKKNKGKRLNLLGKKNKNS